jgi:hypothetical protein
MSVTARIAGAAAMIAGALLAGYSLYRGFAAKPPPLPLLVTLFLGGLVQVVLGAGLWQVRRVAWSFALALYIVTLITGLFAVPALMRGGVSAIVATLPAVFSLAMIVLVSSTPAAPPTSPSERRRAPRDAR